MSDTYDAWMYEMIKEYGAEIEQLKAELAQAVKERDEARAQAATWQEGWGVERGHAEELLTERDAAWALITAIEDSGVWDAPGAAEGPWTGAEIVEEVRRRLARGAELDSLGYTRK